MKKETVRLIAAIGLSICLLGMFFAFLIGMYNTPEFAPYFQGDNIEPTNEMLFGMALVLNLVFLAGFVSSLDGLYRAIRNFCRVKRQEKVEVQ